MCGILSRIADGITNKILGISNWIYRESLGVTIRRFIEETVAEGVLKDDYYKI